MGTQKSGLARWASTARMAWSIAWSGEVWVAEMSGTSILTIGVAGVADVAEVAAEKARSLGSSRKPGIEPGSLAAALRWSIPVTGAPRPSLQALPFAPFATPCATHH